MNTAEYAKDAEEVESSDHLWKRKQQLRLKVMNPCFSASVVLLIV